MNNLNFKVDENKCIHCGLCAKDCVAKVININEAGLPAILNTQQCFGCQHCLSICPVGAISVFDKNPDNSDKIYVQNPDMILNLIKSRKSNRLYKQENVNKETMQKLKEMLPYIPTGCNFHGLHFSFIEDIEIMNDFRNYVNKKIIDGLTTIKVKEVVQKFSSMAKSFIDGEDIIFRGAPHMLVVSNSVKAPCAHEDTIIALSYFELYAQSLGLGTCWCGLGEFCLKVFPELCEYLEIPEGYQAGYVMLFGEKDVNYSRTIQPNDVKISVAKKENIQKLNRIKKVKRYFWNLLR